MEHTAQDLLAAVGVDWHKDYAIVQCPQCKNHRFYCVTGSTWHRFDCSRPDTSNVEPTYTGPALNTPELDAVLWVEGQKRLVGIYENSTHDMFAILGALPDYLFHNSGITLLLSNQPGHALAAAIAETTPC